MPSKIGGLKVTRVYAAPAGGSSGVVQHIFPDFMQHQQQSNWCWSACGTSVGIFFQTGSWTQCDTATGCIQGTDCYHGQPLNCCTNPSSCNCYGYLNAALTYTKSFNQMFGGTYSASDIEVQINMGRPVCVRVAWTHGGAHFLAMTGYSYPDDAPSTVTIYLQDSIYGSSSMLLTDFPSQYHGVGTSTHTYLTQPN